MVIFKSEQTNIEGDLKMKCCGKGLYPTESVNYLGVKTERNLSWQNHVNDVSFKLNRANALLYKMRKYVSLEILGSTYRAIFVSYLTYCCLVQDQNCSTIQRLVILQERAVRIINFQQMNSYTSLLFKTISILKFQYKIFLENILFASKSLSPRVFNKWFSFSSDQHIYETSSSTQGNLKTLFHKTNKYGHYSITVSAVELWNKFQNQLKNKLLKDLSLSKIIHLHIFLS